MMDYDDGIPVYQDYSNDPEEYADPDFYVDRFYGDNEGEMEEFLDDEMSGGLAPFSLAEILQHCIEPTLTDGFRHMSKILVWSVIFRIITQTALVSPGIRHLTSVACGCALLHTFFGPSSLYLAALVPISYLLLVASPGFRGSVMSSLVISYNIGCETWLSDPVTWHQVRGAMMILAMKIISVGYDVDAPATRKAANLNSCSEEAGDAAHAKQNAEVDNQVRNRRKNHSKSKVNHSNAQSNSPASGDEKKENGAAEMAGSSTCEFPGFFEYCGYCLCPGTVILGPWVSLAQYRRIFVEPRWNLTWCLKILLTVFFSFMFLTISTCWNPWLIPDTAGHRWWLAYRDAMSFRASHYFISFISEAAAISAGFGNGQATSSASEDEGTEKSKASAVGGLAGGGSPTRWQLTVTQPHSIEVPRSLVEVVVAWNLPMHAWLKQYVFKQTRKSFGSGMAILATYVASTLLHGLSFQLGAVLLSLGLYTWVEHSLRLKLADIMDASVEARRDALGRRKHKEGHAWVILVNLLFGMLAMFHLAYLGVMFDQSRQSVSGYSWKHTLEKWRQLDFASHWVVAAMFFINWLL